MFARVWVDEEDSASVLWRSFRVVRKQRYLWKFCLFA